MLLKPPGRFGDENGLRNNFQRRDHRHYRTSPPGSSLFLSPGDINRRGANHQGILCGKLCAPARYPEIFIQLYKQGKLPVDRLLTETLPLERINEGFDVGWIKVRRRV